MSAFHPLCLPLFRNIEHFSSFNCNITIEWLVTKMGNESGVQKMVTHIQLVLVFTPIHCLEIGTEVKTRVYFQHNQAHP